MIERAIEVIIILKFVLVSRKGRDCPAAFDIKSSGLYWLAFVANCCAFAFYQGIVF